MRQVAVVGTSNIGCIKFGLDRLSADWPDLSITCYGLPGARFDAAFVRPTGVFAPPDEDGQGRRLAKRINGSVGIDLSGRDAVLVLGDTLGMPNCLWMAAQYDVADWPSRRGRDLISHAAFMSGTREAIETRVTHLARQFDGIRPLHVALAPFPTVAVVPEGKYHQQPYASMAKHPEAARVFALYQEELAAALDARGITFVAQPADTMAQPFLTKYAYGVGALDFRQEGVMLDDHRHMNPAFGASLFRAFALTLSQSTAQGPS
jgi:hypothetical protein